MSQEKYVRREERKKKKTLNTFFPEKLPSDHYEEIAQLVFAYISLLRTTSPPSEELFKEVAALSRLAFEFKESSSPSNTTSMLSMSMSKPYPRAKLLSAPWLSTEWHPDQVDSLLELMTPDKCRLFVTSQKEVGQRTYGEKEKWYGTEYCVEKTSDKILHVSTLSCVNGGFFL